MLLCRIYFLIFISWRVLSTENIGTFWQLTDVHVITNYHQYAKCDSSKIDHNCDSSPTIVNSAIKLISQKPKADFILWTGDNGPHLDRLSLDTVRQSIKFVTQKLKEALPDTYVLPVLGNHDLFPTNTQPLGMNDSERINWCNELAINDQLWGSWIDIELSQSAFYVDRVLSPPHGSFSQGCFHSHLFESPKTNQSKLLLVSLNTMAWYTANPESQHAELDPLGQFDWLEQTLSWARNNAIKVLLAGHVPPGANENRPLKEVHMLQTYNDRLVKLIQMFPDVIIAGLFGHEHIDTFRIVSSDQDDARPLVPLFLAPSITPLHMTGLGSFTPRLRQYTYDRETGLLLAYHQYAANLNSSPSNVQWQLDYATTDDYRLSDLSASNISNLLERMNKNDDLWSLYWRRELGNLSHTPANRSDLINGSCPVGSQCRCWHLCTMRWLDLTRLESCLSRDCRMSEVELVPFRTAAGSSNSGGSDTFTTLPLIVLVIAVFVLLLLGLVYCVNREICNGSYRRRSLANAANGGANLLDDDSPRGSVDEGGSVFHNDVDDNSSDKPMRNSSKFRSFSQSFSHQSGLDRTSSGYADTRRLINNSARGSPRRIANRTHRRNVSDITGTITTNNSNQHVVVLIPDSMLHQQGLIDNDPHHVVLLNRNGGGEVLPPSYLTNDVIINDPGDYSDGNSLRLITRSSTTTTTASTTINNPKHHKDMGIQMTQPSTNHSSSHKLKSLTGPENRQNGCSNSEEGDDDELHDGLCNSDAHKLLVDAEERSNKSNKSLSQSPVLNGTSTLNGTDHSSSSPASYHNHTRPLYLSKKEINLRVRRASEDNHSSTNGNDSDIGRFKLQPDSQYPSSPPSFAHSLSDSTNLSSNLTINGGRDSRPIDNGKLWSRLGHSRTTSTSSTMSSDSPTTNRSSTSAPPLPVVQNTSACTHA